MGNTFLLLEFKLLCFLQELNYLVVFKKKDYMCMKIEQGHFLWRNILEVEASLVSAREKRLGQKLKREEKNMTILSYLSG